MPELSSQQKADQNLAAFLSLVASKTDPDFRELALGSMLNEILEDMA